MFFLSHTRAMRWSLMAKLPAYSSVTRWPSTYTGRTVEWLYIS
jgi:hypothetical protein